MGDQNNAIPEREWRKGRINPALPVVLMYEITFYFFWISSWIFFMVSLSDLGA